MKEIIDKMGFIKIKNFCSAKDNSERLGRQATDWEEILAKDTSNKGILCRICKELLNSTMRKQKGYQK